MKEYNRNINAQILSWSKKVKAIELLGGCCSKCKNTRDYEFPTEFEKIS